MNDNKYLGEFEELLLLVLLRLRDNAYGVTIQEELEKAGRSVSLGAVYTTLERLEQKGFVSSYRGDPTPERGGRAKRFFKIEGAGSQALAEVESVRNALRGNVPVLGGLSCQ